MINQKIKEEMYWKYSGIYYMGNTNIINQLIDSVIERTKQADLKLLNEFLDQHIVLVGLRDLYRNKLLNKEVE